MYVSTILLLTFDFVLTLFALSVVVFIVETRRKRRDPTLRTGFFVLFVALTLIECVRSVTATLVHYFAKLGLYPPIIIDSHAFTKVCAEILEYCFSLQGLFRVAIACNRFTCFYSEPLHRKIWSGRWLTSTLTTIAAVAVLLSIHRLPHSASYHMQATNNFLSIRYDEDDFRKVRATVDASLYVVCSFVCLTLDVGTAVALYNKRKNGMLSLTELKTSPDVRLFAYSILNFFMMLLVTLAQLQMAAIFSVPVLSEFLVNGTLEMYMFLLSAYASLGPLFLIALAPTIRSKYCNFYRFRATKNVRVRVSEVNLQTVNKK